MTSKKNLDVFFCKRWAPIFQIKNVGRHFRPDFAWIFNRSKILGVRLHPHLLQHCYGAWTPAPLSTHLSTRCKCMASKIERPVCTRHTI